MGKTAVIADLHLANHRYGNLTSDLKYGLNSRAQMILRALSGAINKAQSLGCHTLVIAGDLFDHSEPTPALIAATAKILTADFSSDPHKSTQPRIDIVLGNHDMRSYEENAIAPFDSLPGNLVLPSHSPLRTIQGFTTPALVRRGKKAGGSQVDQLIYAPFCVGPASEWLPVAVQEGIDLGLGSHDVSLLVTHVGLITSDTPSFLKGCDDAIQVDLLDEICANAGIPCVIAGNWHKHRVIEGRRGTLMIQCGALVPTGFDNPGLEGYGTLCVYDHETQLVEVHEIPGPRFLKVNSVAEVTQDPPEGFTYYYRVLSESDPGPSTSPASRIEWVRPSQAPIGQDAARSSAQAAETIAESIAAYCDSIKLEPEIDREEVRGRCINYAAGV